MISLIPALFCALVAGFGVAATAMAAPQTFNTALPVAQDEFVFREQFVYRKATDIQFRTGPPALRNEDGQLVSFVFVDVNDDIGIAD